MKNNIDHCKEAFILGNFVIDCEEIRLTQNASDNPIVYSSRGYIEASPEHGIESRIICQRGASDVYDPMAMFVNIDSYTSGVLIPDSHHYRLEARDALGNSWTRRPGR